MESREGGFTAVFSSDDKTSGTTDDFTIRMSPALDLSRAERWSIALADFSLWYTWYNISADYGNNEFKYSHNGGADWTTIEIEPGIYKAGDLITAIELLITAEGHDPANLVIEANQNTQRFIFTFSGGYQVDFTDMAIRTIFGAESAVYTTSGPMPNVAKMTNGVNSWILNSDLIDYGIQGQYQGRVLHSFSPQVAPGSHIREIPQKYYTLVKSAKSISDVRFWITDQTGRRINLNDEPVSIRLHFKPLALVK